MRKEESLKQCPSCASKIDYKCPNNNNNNSSLPQIQRMNAFELPQIQRMNAFDLPQIQRMNAFDQQYYNLLYDRIDPDD